MKYFTDFCELLLNQLTNLTSVSITFSVEYFSAIFKNNTHALCKQSRPCKEGWNVYMRKKRPNNVRSRFYERGIPNRSKNLFS